MAPSSSSRAHQDLFRIVLVGKSTESKKTINDILFYSEGNVGRARNFGLSSTLVISPFKWWSLTAQATYNHKELKGFNGNVNFKSDINQLNLNLNNQFIILKKYTAEISGFYTSRARNDLQELLYPTGQLALV